MELFITLSILAWVAAAVAMITMLLNAFDRIKDTRHDVGLILEVLRGLEAAASPKKD